MAEAQGIKACESIPLSSGKLYGIGEAKNLKYAGYIILHFVFVSRQKYFPHDFFSKRFFQEKLKKTHTQEMRKAFPVPDAGSVGFQKTRLRCVEY